MTERTVENDDKSESSMPISSNDLFTTIYDISQAIFHHLPIRSLDSCSSVCQSWTQQIRFIKENRHTIHSLSYPSDLLTLTREKSYDLSNFDKFISSYINDNLWSLPSLALVVTTNSLDRKGFISSSAATPPLSKYPKRSQSSTRNAEKVEIPQALIHHLNKSCKLLQIISSGIVSTNDQNQSYEIERENAMGILLLPKFPSNTVGIYPFVIQYSTKIPDDMSRSDLHRLLGCVPDDVPIRCVIFFFTRHPSHGIDSIKKIRDYYSTNVAIIGGFAEKMRYNDRQTELKSSVNNTCGIVLTGDPKHLNIRQILLDSNINTRESVREKLKQLKSIENNEYLSFAIQVSCVARGSDFYDEEKHVECSEFKALFPKTPLIGIFGNGEIGHDYLLDDNQTLQHEQRTTKETSNDIFHTYSTVFSLISMRL